MILSLIINRVLDVCIIEVDINKVQNTGNEPIFFFFKRDERRSGKKDEQKNWTAAAHSLFMRIIMMYFRKPKRSATTGRIERRMLAFDHLNERDPAHL